MEAKNGKRKLSKEQVRQLVDAADAVSAWHARFRNIPSLNQMAREIGIPRRTLIHVIVRGPDYRHRAFGLGYPGQPSRAYEPATLRRIFEWHSHFLAAQESCPPWAICSDFAESFHVSERTIREVASRRLVYKAPAPEDREKVRAERARKIARLRALNLY